MKEQVTDMSQVFEHLRKNQGKRLARQKEILKREKIRIAQLDEAVAAREAENNMPMQVVSIRHRIHNEYGEACSVYPLHLPGGTW